MALSQIALNPKPKGKGGLIGKIVGGVVGAGAAAAAPFTGGATLPLVATGFGVGSTVGGLVGEKADPQKSTKGGVPLQAVAKDPEVQLVALDEGQKLIRKDTRIDTSEASSLLDQMEKAKQVLRSRLGGV